MMRKKDSEVVSVSSGNSKGSDRRKNTRFSLRRIFYVTRGGSSRSRSHASLDSESGKSDASFNANAPSEEPQRSPAGSEFKQPVPRSPVCSEDQQSKRSNGSTKECPLCLSERPLEDFPEIMTCHHRSCLVCLQTYLKIEITESRINISCPECAEKFHPNDIQSILKNDILMEKYEDFMVRRILVSDPDARWCPAPDCGYAVIATGCAGCPKLKCERPGCDTYFCYHCKQHWHPNQTCDAARAERSPNMRSASISYNGHDTDSQKDDIKPCPRCGAFIMKMNDGSCNHMACPVCGAEFCWLCMKEISDLHYLSPSGCTFWGKKPWSRKKKILWQLGTLVGAPVGITLIAGIAMPAMVIGIPVWVGRKIYSKYEHSPKHSRNLAITGGVAASILAAPVIAGLAVGIGVPILLAYVYGVVPFSLCRSGGCGVHATNKGGVRFEFDENDTAGPVGPNSDNQSVVTGHHVANPSIAPSIGDASLGMTGSLSASGSHMERVGIIRDESDRDSTSNRAIAGSSLNGSLCGGSYAGSYQHKLEVHADVSTNLNLNTKRASFSSESANFSIGEKSVTVSFGDNASTKALAGSIAGYQDKDNVSMSSPLEVQVDLLSNTSRGRLNSGGSASITAGSHCDRHRNMSGQSSPISGCSYSLNGTEDSRSHIYKCRKCKRSNTNAGDRIAEQCSVHFADQVSLQSFQTTDMISQGFSYSSEECLDVNDQESIFVDKASDSVLKSVDCFQKRSHLNETNDVLPEVESDKLVNIKPSNMPAGVKAVSTSALSCQVKCTDSQRSLCKSKSQEYYVVSREEKLSPVKRIRHRSCELAIENGRISPTLINTETDPST